MRLTLILLLISISASTLTAQRGLMKKANNAHLVEKDYEKSLTLYSRAVQKKPKNDMALNGVGMALYRLKRYKESLEVYNKAIQINKGNLTLYANRANTYFALKNPTLAMQDLNLVLELNPKDAISYSNRGMVKDGEKDYDGAIVDYCKAIELGLSNADVYNNRGVSYWKTGQLEKAERDYLQAISLDESYPQVYANYGALLLESFGRPHDAIPYFEKSFELGVDDCGMFFKLGFAFEAIGQYSLSEDYYSKAINENPKYGNAYFNRGAVRASLENYGGALEDYSEALKLDSLNTGVLTNRALLIYDKLGEYPKAISDLQRSISITESKGDEPAYGYNNLGYIQYKIKDLSSAQANVEYSIELDSLNSYAFRNLALIQIAQGELEQACLNTEKAISLGFIERFGDGILRIKNEACE
ncbi:MAG: tetratricopeptide repeat protein [Flavobacteriales bacterium]|nr:tetratricopeptide repeat protein [Flavobacteriales bacterium]